MRKNKQFGIRISAQDLETIRRKAAQAHMTQSDYVTACCLGKRIVILDGLKDVLRQQKAIGNNLNQLAVLANMGKCSSPIWILLRRSFPRSTLPCGSCRREVQEDRNRPFRELQKGHTNARVHEKCHSLRFPTQQDVVEWTAARQRDRLPAGNRVR